MYTFTLQIFPNLLILLPHPLPQLLVLLMQLFILLLQFPDLLFQQLNPAAHRFIEDISAWVDGSGLLFQRLVDLGPHNRILIKEASGKSGHLHQLRDRYPVPFFQHLPDLQLCRSDLFIAFLPVQFDHFIVFVHSLHPTLPGLQAGSWSVLPWLCAARSWLLIFR